ncbi:MAG TPA: DUF3617 family protein [Steroidobacteraceae bacterium]|nr:DUF3617 family protein [Steroidobacteraceae bacterium]
MARLLITTLAAALMPAAARADEFLAMPGLWQTAYEVDGATAGADDNKGSAPRVVWHCVDEAANPWVSFAQLQDLPGMTCKASSQERSSTSLKWQTECHGPGPEAVADVIEVSGAIVFDSPQHYRGWVRFNGTLMGYPLHSSSKVEGTHKAACTSPSD